MKTNSAILLMIIAATVIGCAANLKRPSIQEQPLARGDRIRVSTSKVVVGTFDSLEADTLFLENQITLPLSSVTKLEVSRGKKRSAGRAVGFGFLGVLGGALVGAAIGEMSRDCADFDTEECDYGEVVVGAGAGALLGGLGGAVIGGSTGSREIWEEVPLAKVRQSSAK